MKREIITTADGSKTIQIVDWNEQYHSKHGAVNEAIHVFIKQGLYHFIKENEHLENDMLNQKTKISILEIGFGTGLNAFITCHEASQNKFNIDYVGVEAYPVDSKEIELLNYPQKIKDSNSEVFNRLHEVSWNEKNRITPCFFLTKRKHYFLDIKDENAFNIIYFDAFGSRVQPELWTEAIFKIMYKALKKGGVLVTYSAKGSVRRIMQTIGFKVERIQGPPGKRHMLRATK